MSLEYVFPEPKIMTPGDTIHTFETFVSVHQKDCFATLRNYGSYMKTKGIVSAPSEPAAYEPIWCAWGYERNFTLDEIYRTLPKVKALGIKWVGLDDGYQQANGDWHTNTEHFPGGDAQMKSFVDSLHAMGLKAVIWWAPLAMDINSNIFKTNPGTALIQQNGAPVHHVLERLLYVAHGFRGDERNQKTVQLFWANGDLMRSNSTGSI
jgi:alpha-galactosidase